tara:strand:+ start:839 stop:1171 length:333 start_codon:yes stop_codon:yes gene_type:complete
METIEYELELIDYEEEDIARLGLMTMGADDLKGVEKPLEDGVIRLFCEVYISEPAEATRYSPPEHGHAELHDISVEIDGNLVKVDIGFDFDDIEAIEEDLFNTWESSGGH